MCISNIKMVLTLRLLVIVNYIWIDPLQFYY